MVKKQAEAPVYQLKTTPDGYTEEFKKAVERLIEKDGISGMVFGNIFLEEHKKWIEDVCNALGIKPIMPLWNKAFCD